jgi:hypothetical protein
MNGRQSQAGSLKKKQHEGIDWETKPSWDPEKRDNREMIGRQSQSGSLKKETTGK